MRLCSLCGEDLDHASQIFIHECNRWALGAPRRLRPPAPSLGVHRYGRGVLHVLSLERRIAGGSVVRVARCQDNPAQRLADGSIHPAHRAGFAWDEPAQNVIALVDLSVLRFVMSR
jgi:hypothetical protein